MRNAFTRMQPVTRSPLRPKAWTMRICSCLWPCVRALNNRDHRKNVEVDILRKELRECEACDTLESLCSVALQALQMDDHEHSRRLCSELERMCSNSSTARNDKKLDAIIKGLLSHIHRMDSIQCCAICMSRPRCVVLLPCAHLVTCHECECTTCPMCTNTVDSTLYVFTS